jgi:hypothetical protein
MLGLIRLVIFGFLIYLAYRLVKWIIMSPGIKGRDMPGHQEIGRASCRERV